MARVIAVRGAPETRSRVLIVAAAVFAVIAALLVFVALQNRSEGSTNSSAGLVPVVVATRDLQANTTLTSDMLKVQPVPPDVALSGVYGRTDALAGTVTRYPVLKGQQLTGSVLGTDAAPNADDLSYALPPGKRAVGVEVSEVTGVGGLLLPGNSVDVIAVFNVNATGASKAVTLLQNVVVLAVGQEAQQPAPRPSDGAAADTTSAQKDAKRQPDARTVTLAVGPADAQLLALAQDNGKLWLSLRPAGDADTPPLGEQLLPGSPGSE
jgi:pilus assembly protein CpaB